MTAGPRLSPRLEMVLSLAPQASVYCDVGTDHGYIAAALAMKGGRVLALDINAAPLEQAAGNIARFGLDGRVETRLSDGFSALGPGEADCAVIAGMGGELIADILDRGTKEIRYFVLQPQSKFYELRDYLNKNGFLILKEDLCREDERYYVAMLARRAAGVRPLSEAEKHIGPLLLRERPPLLREYLASRRLETERILEKIGGAETPRRAECAGLIEMYRKYERELEG